MTPHLKNVNAFIAALQAMEGPGIFNPWRDRSRCDASPTAVADRIDRLRAHLSIERPAIIAIGEAPGWRGCRYSGIAFSSERLLTTGLPRVPIVRRRITTMAATLSEPSATIVWQALREFGLDYSTVLWNTFAWHPFAQDEHTNRTPTPAELKAGMPVLQQFLHLYDTSAVVAIGQIAQRALQTILERNVALLRHPSMGGKSRFRSDLHSLAVERDIYRPEQPALL